MTDPILVIPDKPPIAATRQPCGRPWFVESHTYQDAADAAAAILLACATDVARSEVW
jgi:hypothetical protein